jgi:hypothetical protein
LEFWVFVALAVIGIAVGLVAWRWPRSAKTPPPKPPSLRLEQVGGVGNQKGDSSENLKTKLRLVNDAGGTARNWEVSIATGASQGIKLVKYPLRGPAQFADPLQWHQDAPLGEIPAGQGREFAEFLHVAGPTAAEFDLQVTIRAEGAEEQMGSLLVKLPSAPGGPAVEYEDQAPR